MKNFAVLISGFGRGAIEIIIDYKSGKIKPTLGLVLSTSLSSEAINIARQNGIETSIVVKSKFENKSKFEQHIISILKKKNIEYLFLAGYKYIIDEELLEEYPNRIVNIHPSLLPVFKGIYAIDQALDYGVKITGITTHFVNKELDGGRIIMQQAVAIENDDTFNDVDAKIFKAGTIITTNTINQVFV